MSLLVVAAWFTLLAPAYAQAGYGVRAGVGADPTQFFVGGHVESPALEDRGQLTFRPNVEIGFASGAQSVAGNLEVVYWVPFPMTEWFLYVGAGPAVVFAHNDFESRAHGGFNGLVGFQHSGGLFAEVKVGQFGAGGGLKVTVGYALKVVPRGATPAPGK